MSRIALAVATVVTALSLAAPAVAETLRVELPFGLDAIDPALSYTNFSWQIQYATCVKLYNYADRNTASPPFPEPEAAACRRSSHGTGSRTPSPSYRDNFGLLLPRTSP